eukprot:jgi/Picre1/29260/NNA_004652.t1
MNDASPCTFTSVTPAWNNDNLNRLAMKLESGLIFAHVRAAYPGMPVSEQNCHPFAHENYLFMHNGVVAGFLDIRRQLISIMNDEAYNAVQSFHSDSAVCFGLFLHHLPDTKKRQTPEVLLRAIQATVSTITRVQKENGIEGTSFVELCCDGWGDDCGDEISGLSRDFFGVSSIQDDSFVVSASGSATGKRGGAVIGEGSYGLSYAGTETRVCLVASEPVTDCTSDWNAVEPNTALVISKDSKGILTVFKAWLANEGEHPDNEEVYRCLETVDEKLVDGGLDAHIQESVKRILRSGSLKSGSGGTTPRGGGEMI